MLGRVCLQSHHPGWGGPSHTAQCCNGRSGDRTRHKPEKVGCVQQLA
ncbi:MAG: hypothetical protein KME45_01085 [Stenomitos rutilans HA7619-LM2]|nr:hypothetical protein [Stenomitos rutilans HA7619-LM2]